MSTTFHVRITNDPQALLRIMGFFSQRALTVERVEAVLHGDHYCLSITCPCDAHQAEVIQQKIQQMVLVRQVSMETPLPIAA